MLLIPFLLGVELINPQPNGESYGVESTFRCEAGLILSSTDRQHTENVRFILKCRLKNETTMRCLVTDGNLGTPEENDAMKIPFEFYFDPTYRGVRTITVLGEAPLFVVQGLRRIAGLMSVGTYTGRRLSSDILLLTDEGLPDDCDTATEVIEQSADEPTEGSVEEPMTNEAESKNYRLTSPLFISNDTEELNVTTFLDAENCGGNLGFLKHLTPHGAVNITSYTNTVHVTKEGNFTGSGHMRASQIIDWHVQTKIDVDIYLSMELDGVEPATDPLPDESPDYTTTVTIS